MEAVLADGIRPENAIGTAYVAGGEMTQNIEKMGGEGTAAFVFKAIKIYCGR